MDLEEYRASPAEEERTADLMRLVPPKGSVALDVGARDGFFSVLLAERFERVIALDLNLPTIRHSRIECVQGNAAALDLPDASVDFVFCAEVLEHIPQDLLSRTCSELERVCRGRMLIGVPYKQDTRVGRTTCYSCMRKNPPWGHVNTFDERRLVELLGGCAVEAISFVGTTKDATNAFSCYLMDLAGNPYGTYVQAEPCVHCGQRLDRPPGRSLSQRILTKLAFWAQYPAVALAKPRAKWMHVLLSRH